VNFRVETGIATQEDFDLLNALDTVQQEMQAKPKPNPEAVASATTHAREILAGWFDGQPGTHERHMFRSDRLGQVIASAAGNPNTFRTWESAVQFYLAAVAARESWPGGWDGPLRNVADRLQFGLRYPEMIDVSRYAKRDGNGPTLTPAQAMSLGIELAGWLGPVQPEMILDQEEDLATPQLRVQMRRMLDRINARWNAINEQRAAEADNAPATEVPDVGREDPPTRPKTREELLEELRQRRNAEPDSMENGF
jgi:hypothetical protein